MSCRKPRCAGPKQKWAELVEASFFNSIGTSGPFLENLWNFIGKFSERPKDFISVPRETANKSRELTVDRAQLLIQSHKAKGNR